MSPIDDEHPKKEARLLESDCKWIFAALPVRQRAQQNGSIYEALSQIDPVYL